MPTVIVVAHNIRSAHNVGAIFRTSEGFGVTRLILSGYTPYPTLPTDTRLPHIARRVTAQIEKTALGAETIVTFEHQEEPDFGALKKQGYVIVGLEQDDRSVDIRTFVPPEKIVLILGEEVAGLSPVLRSVCDVLVEIPMKGHKESFNVSVAAGIALYGLTAHS